MADPTPPAPAIPIGPSRPAGPAWLVAGFIALGIWTLALTAYLVAPLVRPAPAGGRSAAAVVGAGKPVAPPPPEVKPAPPSEPKPPPQPPPSSDPVSTAARGYVRALASGYAAASKAASGGAGRDDAYKALGDALKGPGDDLGKALEADPDFAAALARASRAIESSAGRPATGH